MSRRSRSRDRRRSSFMGTSPLEISRRGSHSRESRRGRRKRDESTGSRTSRRQSAGSHSDEEQRDSRASSVHFVDQDLEYLLAQFIKERRRSKAGRSHKRQGSTDVSASGESDDESILHMYEEDAGEGTARSSEEEEIFENIKLQKEIIENVRYQPWSMGKKRQMLGLAKMYVEKHEGQLSLSHGYQEKGAQVLRQLKRELGNLQKIFIPWEMRIKQIESHFGSVVASYFVFLRWLVWINVWLTIIPVCFVILPEALVGADYGTAPRKRPPDKKIDEMANLKTIWNAEGIVKYSLMFYGYYGKEESIGSGYRLPLAYFVTGMVSLAFSFVVILRRLLTTVTMMFRMASNSRMNRSSSKDEQFTFSWKLFTSWDYMIGNTETANNKVAAINISFKEAILEEEEKVKDGNKYLTYFLRFLANFFVVIMLGSSTYAIHILVERSRDIEDRKLRYNYEATFWEENEVTVVMTLISTLFPNVVELLSVMEKYHPRTALRWQLARIFVMNLINLYTLFISLYNKAGDMQKISKAHTSLCDVASSSTLPPVSSNLSNSVSTLNLTAATTPCTVTSTTPIAPQCWETMIGQELVKLTLLDLVFFVGQVILIDFIRGLCVKYLNVLCCWDLETKFPEYPEFKTAENILHLINNQGMIWLGSFFSPGLPPLNMIKMFVLLYLRCWACLVCNVPQDRIFRASRSNNFYYSLLLIMLFLCTLPVIFAIMIMKPSKHCGPFSDFKEMSDVVVSTMRANLSKTTMVVLGYIASPAVIIPLFMLLALGIYYLLSTNRSKGEINKDLKMQLEYERTEGRKKVYAMAGAKKELDEVGGDLEHTTTLGRKMATVKDQEKPSMARAVSSMMAATKMARLLAHEKRTKPQTDLPTLPPVAVVRGKQTLPGKGKATRRPTLDEATGRRSATGTSEEQSAGAESDVTVVAQRWRRAVARNQSEAAGSSGERTIRRGQGDRGGSERTRSDGHVTPRSTDGMNEEERAAWLIQAMYRRKKGMNRQGNDELSAEGNNNATRSKQDRTRPRKRDVPAHRGGNSRHKRRFLAVDDSLETSDSDSEDDKPTGMWLDVPLDVHDRRTRSEHRTARRDRTAPTAHASGSNGERSSRPVIPHIMVTDYSDNVEDDTQDDGEQRHKINTNETAEDRNGTALRSESGVAQGRKVTRENLTKRDDQVVIDMPESTQSDIDMDGAGPQENLIHDLTRKMGRVPPVPRKKAFAHTAKWVRDEHIYGGTDRVKPTELSIQDPGGVVTVDIEEDPNAPLQNEVDRLEHHPVTVDLSPSERADDNTTDPSTSESPVTSVGGSGYKTKALWGRLLRNKKL